MTSQRTTAAGLLTLAWSRDADAPDLPGVDQRRAVLEEALEWQQLSEHGQSRMEEMAPTRLGRRRSSRYNGVLRVIEGNYGVAPMNVLPRVLEIHALAGGIGEQVALAYAAEQDVQRWMLLGADSDPIEVRLAVRALCETSMYFTLGALQGLGNLLIRCALINSRSARAVTTKGQFPVWSKDSDDWPSFRTSLTRLDKLRGELTDPVCGMLDVLKRLRDDDRYLRLEERRGNDYHRMRAQSIPVAAHADVVGASQDGGTVLRLGGTQLNPDSDPAVVQPIAADAELLLSGAMQKMRSKLPAVFRHEGYVYLTFDDSDVPETVPDPNSK